MSRGDARYLVGILLVVLVVLLVFKTIPLGGGSGGLIP